MENITENITEKNKENIKPRKKDRKIREYLLNKEKREKGQEYTTCKGKIIPEKSFSKIICKCRKSCHLSIDENKQKSIFQSFYGLKSWTEKTTFILNHMEISECKKRRKADARKNIRFKKMSHREYFFISEHHQVCKNFFKKVLQISEGRIEKCVQKKQSNPGTCAIDFRGKHSLRKKTPAHKIQIAIKFINSLPHYESHYTRNTKNEKKYLDASLNLKILYSEYKNYCNEKDTASVSMYMFRDIFYRKFNLRFKAPAQDTCDYCNKIEMKIKAAPIKSVERMKLIKEKTNHLNEIESLSREYNDIVSESKLSIDTKIVLVFDLEKVFETPKLSTNKAYYKRKLSTYNCCIHDVTHNRTYMYVWHEAMASKGPQEIASCLIYHFKNFIPKECTDLILYSDSCGGQNRSIKTSAMLSHFVEKSDHLKKITQQFFRSGHSYNVCDRKFALIEKKRKKAINIYVPNHWIELIKSAKQTDPKFNVIEMKPSFFLSCEKLLQNFCTNRKKTTNKEGVNWFTFRKMTYEKQNPFQIFFETYEDVACKYDETLEFPPNVTKQLPVAKRNFQRQDFIQTELDQLYPNGKRISTEKKNDLLDLLNYIPQPFHRFYTNIDHTDFEEEEQTILISDESDVETCVQ